MNTEEKKTPPPLPPIPTTKSHTNENLDSISHSKEFREKDYQAGLQNKSQDSYIFVSPTSKASHLNDSEKEADSHVIILIISENRNRWKQTNRE